MSYVSDWLNITKPYNVDLNLTNVISNISSLQNMEQIFSITSVGSRDQPQSSHFLIIYVILGIFMVAICCLLCKTRNNTMKTDMKDKLNISLERKEDPVKIKNVDIKDCKINPYE